MSASIIFHSDGQLDRFQGRFSLRTKHPVVVFRMVTSPCFHSYWCIHSSYEPGDRFKRERRIRKAIAASKDNGVLAQIEEAKEGYWLTLPLPTETDAACKRELVACIDPLKVKWFGSVQKVGMEPLRASLPPARLLEGTGTGVITLLEMLARADWDEAAEFLLSDPGFWKLPEAAQAVAILSGLSPQLSSGMEKLNAWLAEIIIRECEGNVESIFNSISAERLLYKAEPGGMSLLDLILRMNDRQAGGIPRDQFAQRLADVLAKKGVRGPTNRGR